MLLRLVQFTGLIVQQAQHAEHANVCGQQWAACKKTHVRGSYNQVVITEALIAMGIGDDEDGVGATQGFPKATDPGRLAKSQAVAGFDLLAFLGASRDQRGDDAEMASGQAR
ncbi:hypothetical protein THL1_567 [Pseudomonas sp. TCU-HL1]|nr:hypothetical protein THL1_567 [Pseudomonas sp. TCU-HL1]